jgi:hypothetical protein
MFTLIIIIAGLIFAAGYLKSLTPTQRAITIRWTMNKLTLGIVYTARGAKEGAKIAYQAGKYSGSEVALKGMSQFKSMAESNKAIAEEGGSTKIAIRKSQQHGSTLGLSNIADDLKAKADANALKLAEAEAELEAILATYVK